MGVFDGFKKKEDSENKACSLLDRYRAGEITEREFLPDFEKETIYYSTPYGDCRDGSKKLFVLTKPDKSCYQPAFTSAERLMEFYERMGRVGYMIIEGTFSSLLEVTAKINAGKAPVKLGVVIDPVYFDFLVDAPNIENVIKKIKG